MFACLRVLADGIAPGAIESVPEEKAKTSSKEQTRTTIRPTCCAALSAPAERVDDLVRVPAGYETTRIALVRNWLRLHRSRIRGVAAGAGIPLVPGSYVRSS